MSASSISTKSASFFESNAEDNGAITDISWAQIEGCLDEWSNKNSHQVTFFNSTTASSATQPPKEIASDVKAFLNDGIEKFAQNNTAYSKSLGVAAFKQIWKEHMEPFEGSCRPAWVCINRADGRADALSSLQVVVKDEKGKETGQVRKGTLLDVVEWMFKFFKTRTALKLASSKKLMMNAGVGNGEGGNSAFKNKITIPPPNSSKASSSSATLSLKGSNRESEAGKTIIDFKIGKDNWIYYKNYRKFFEDMLEEEMTEAVAEDRKRKLKSACGAFLAGSATEPKQKMGVSFYISSYFVYFFKRGKGDIAASGLFISQLFCLKVVSHLNYVILQWKM
jgi:hypothetical protein